MTTKRLYLDDPDVLDFDATILERRLIDGQDAVVLDQTAFYPEGGGQPWDLGTLSGSKVEKVVYDGRTVLHFVDRAPAEDKVEGRVDAVRRRDHMQQHHGQHLLSRAVESGAGARTVSFHLGASVSSIDLDREISADQAAASEALVNDVIWENRTVTVRVVTRAQAEALGVHAAEEAGDAIRLVEAAGFDLQPCGGTHPRSTAAVGVVAITGQERYKGGSRLHFVCGVRALTLWRDRRLVLSRLGSLLSTPPEKADEAAERALGRLADAERAQQSLMKQLVDLEVARLTTAAQDGAIRRILDGWPMADLRTLVQRLLAGSVTAAAVGSRTAGGANLILAGKGEGADLRPILAKALAHVEGKGGGQPRFVQGTGPKADGLESAVNEAATAMGLSNS